MPHPVTMISYSGRKRRSQPLEPRKDGELRRAQTGQRQELIVKLRDVPGRRPDGKAVAILGPWNGLSGHPQVLTSRDEFICVEYIGAYALMSIGVHEVS